MSVIYDAKVLKDLDRYFNAVNREKRPQFDHLHPPFISQVCPFREKKTTQWSINDFKFIRILGEGGFGTVHLAEHRKSKWKCALKLSKKSELKKHNDLCHLFQEIRIHTLVSGHPNIVQLYGAFDIPQEDFYVMVLEYMNGVELSEFIRERSSISFKRVQEIFYQVILAVDFVHSQGVIHRDVKSENFMINPDTREVKLLDFGLSLMSNQSRRTVGGTYEFMGPELQKSEDAEGKFQYSNKIDVWSCGIILYELLAGKVPWPELNEDYYPQFARSLNASARLTAEIPNMEKCVPLQLRPVLEKLLRTDPRQRISLREVLETRTLFGSLDGEEESYQPEEIEYMNKPEAGCFRRFSVLVRGPFSDWEIHKSVDPRGPSRPSWHTRERKKESQADPNGYNEYYFAKMNDGNLDYRSLVFYYDLENADEEEEKDETDVSPAELLEAMSDTNGYSNVKTKHFESLVPFEKIESKRKK